MAHFHSINTWQIKQGITIMYSECQLGINGIMRTEYEMCCNNDVSCMDGSLSYYAPNIPQNFSNMSEATIDCRHNIYLYRKKYKETNSLPTHYTSI